MTIESSGWGYQYGVSSRCRGDHCITNPTCSVQVMTTAVSQRASSGGGSSGGRNRRAVAGNSDGPLITAGEALLLAEIPAKFADKPWIVDSSEMPCTARLVRPSSAAANLQSHPSYTSGLFDCHITASPRSDEGSPGGLRHVPRPKTGVPRFRNYGRAASRTALSSWKHQRRLTLTGVETSSDSNLVTRRTFVQHKLNADLKVKVSETSDNSDPCL